MHRLRYNNYKLPKKWEKQGWKVDPRNIFVNAFLRIHKGCYQTVQQAINFHRGWIATQFDQFGNRVKTTDHNSPAKAFEKLK